MKIAWLDPGDGPDVLPDPSQALKTPDGLLAAGGSLAPAWLLAAYSRGIFPWFEDGQPILWWSPDPRAVLVPGEFRRSRSLRRSIRRGLFRCTADRAFAQVIDGCAARRSDHSSTWITREMRDAYCRLHALGHAHSVEAWHGDTLAGGLYGVAIGRVFFGESMFARESDASKVALSWLVTRLTDWGYALIDCQQDTAHLARMGARPVPRREFLSCLAELIVAAPSPDSWCERAAPNAG